MKRVLTITLDDDWKKVLRQSGKKVCAGLRSGRYQGERLNFETPAAFFSHLTPNRWEMIRVLQGAGEIGVRELARRLGRDVRRVHDDARALVALGLVERTDAGKLRCPYDEIHLDMHLRAA